MLTGLLHAHSGLRYLILALGLLVVLVSALGVMQKKPYSKLMRVSASIFAGSLHLQVLLGFVLLMSGRFYPALIGHIFLLLIAAVVAQIPVSVLRRRPVEERTYMPHLVSTLVTLGLIWAGVASIGRGLLQSNVY
jgi:hypothetical protein